MMTDEKLSQVMQAVTFVANELINDSVDQNKRRLRDSFAQAALGSLIQKGYDAQGAALAAYAYADAMMKARAEPQDSTDEAAH